MNKGIFIYTEYLYRFALAALMVAIPTGVHAGLKPGAIDIGSTSYIAKYVLFLILVLALCFFCLWLLKKIKFNRIIHSGVIKIVSSYSIGQREKLILISVGKDYLLLGQANGNIQLLYKLDEEPCIPGESEVSDNKNMDFVSSLKRYMSEQKTKV